MRQSVLLLNLLFGAALASSLIWRPSPPPKFGGLMAADLPRRVSAGDSAFAFAGEQPIAESARRQLTSASLVSVAYVPAGGSNPRRRVDVTLIGGTDRSALHDPRSCFVGAGWRIEGDHTEPIPGTPLTARACTLRQDDGSGVYDVLYLYLVDGRVVDDVTRIRTEMALSALLGRKNRPVYFVRFTRPAAAAGPVGADEHAELLRFAAALWREVGPRLTEPATAGS
jgi:hypothetical protein